MNDVPHLNSHHRATLEKVFSHGQSVEWGHALSLLEALGQVEEKHNGRWAVTLGSESETFDAPKSGQLEVGQLVDIRRMLAQAGYGPAGQRAERGDPAPAPELQGKQVVMVVDFHRTRVWSTDAAPGTAPHTLLPYDLRGYFHHVAHFRENPYGVYEADSPEYWKHLTEFLAGVGEALVLGHGKGKARASQHFLDYARTHRPDLAAKVVADLRVDVADLSEGQILALARDFFGSAPRLDFGDSRRGEPPGRE